MCFWLVLLRVEAHFLPSLCVEVVRWDLGDGVVLLCYEFFKGVVAYLFGPLLKISKKTAWVVVQSLLLHSFKQSFFSFSQQGEEFLLLFV